MRVDWIGHQRNPVVVIDDFASDPHAQCAVSAQLEFVSVPQRYYPGPRAIAPPG